MTSTQDPDTLVTRLGRTPAQHKGCVNPGLYQTSTVIFETYESYLDAENNKAPGYEHLGTPTNADFSYSVIGTPTTYELAHAIAELERGEDGPPTTGFVTTSGLAAISVTLLSLVAVALYPIVTNVRRPKPRSEPAAA